MRVRHGIESGVDHERVWLATLSISVEFGFQQRVDRGVEVEREAGRACDAESPIEIETARAIHEQLDFGPAQCERSR